MVMLCGVIHGNACDQEEGGLTLRRLDTRGRGESSILSRNPGERGFECWERMLFGLAVDGKIELPRDYRRNQHVHFAPVLRLGRIKCMLKDPLRER